MKFVSVSSWTNYATSSSVNNNQRKQSIMELCTASGITYFRLSLYCSVRRGFYSVWWFCIIGADSHKNRILMKMEVILSNAFKWGCRVSLHIRHTTYHQSRNDGFVFFTLNSLLFEWQKQTVPWRCLVHIHLITRWQITSRSIALYYVLANEPGYFDLNEKWSTDRVNYGSRYDIGNNRFPSSLRSSIGRHSLSFWYLLAVVTNCIQSW